MSDHRCLVGGKCVAAEVTVEGDKKTRTPAATEAPDTLCEPCIKRIRYAVEDLPFDYVALHVSLGETSRAAGARVRSTPTPPLPIDKHKYALMTAISENLDRAAEIVSDALKCDPPDGKVAPRVQKCARMISTNVEKLLASEPVDCWVWESCDQRCGPKGCDLSEHLRLSERTGLQFAQTLLDLHRRAKAAVGEFQKLLRLPMPCGQCAAPFVYQAPDSDAIFCRDCGTDWREELLAFAGRLSKQREEEMDRQERTHVWLEAEKLYMRAKSAEDRLAEVGKMASLNPDDPDIEGMNVATFITYLKQVMAA